MPVLTPGSVAELSELLRGATAPLAVEGTGSKRALGRPVAAAQRLSLAAFAGIALYEPEELILEAGAATPLAEIEATLAARRQQLAFEPPDHSRLFGSGSAGTLGGVLACNLSGPRRLSAGAARDHILRIDGVSGDGVAFQAGARVVKNVTGYDLPKLMAGSFGTLACLTRITFKVLPAAETEETLVLPDVGTAAAVAAMSLAMGSACEVSAAAHVAGRGTCLRLEGIAASVTYRRDRLWSVLGRQGEVLTATDSRRLWAAVRDVDALPRDDADVVWKLSVPPGDAPRLLATLAPKAVLLDWAGGLVWLALPAAADAHAPRLRAALASGHATLIRAPEAVRAAVAVFQPQPAPLAALAARVKQAFDGRGILNPGRMVAGR
jgi:glycolate oxidase FAD binding subunit